MSAAGDPILSIRHLTKHFPIRQGLIGRAKRRVHAVDDVSFEVGRGETLGVVGESGCGKSTLGHCLVRLHEVTSGEIRFEGRDITHLSKRGLRPVRRHLQIIFQDPYSSLNPRKRVGRIIGDPLRIHGQMSKSAIERRVSELLGLVGLSAEYAQRYPHEFSGGQRQRVGVARALALDPALIVADEPVSALDTSIQAQIVNLLADLQRSLRLTYIFIAHDLGVVRQVSDRIAVMYLGKIVELAPAEELCEQPIHPYTEALLSAVPVADPDEAKHRERIVLTGDVGNPITPPSGCRFHPRCPYATDICRREEPALVSHVAGRLAACHHPLHLEPPRRHAEALQADSRRSADNGT